MSLVQHKFSDEEIIGALGGERTGVIHVGLHSLENTIAFSRKDIEVMAKAIGVIEEPWNEVSVVGCPAVGEIVSLLIGDELQEGVYYLDAHDPSDLYVEYFWVSNITGDTLPIESGQKWRYVR